MRGNGLIAAHTLFVPAAMSALCAHSPPTKSAQVVPSGPNPPAVLIGINSGQPRARAIDVRLDGANRAAADSDIGGFCIRGSPMQ
jgi:class 3 adenylate cyclase